MIHAKQNMHLTLFCHRGFLSFILILFDKQTCSQIPHPVILADEPTANLDSTTGLKIIDFMKKINEIDKTTFIFSTHDRGVMEHSKRTIRLVDGDIVKD